MKYTFLYSEIIGLVRNDDSTIVYLALGERIVIPGVSHYEPLKSAWEEYLRLTAGFGYKDGTYYVREGERVRELAPSKCVLDEGIMWYGQYKAGTVSNQ